MSNKPRKTCQVEKLVEGNIDSARETLALFHKFEISAVGDLEMCWLGHDFCITMQKKSNGTTTSALHRIGSEPMMFSTEFLNEEDYERPAVFEEILDSVTADFTYEMHEPMIMLGASGDYGVLSAYRTLDDAYVREEYFFEVTSS